MNEAELKARRQQLIAEIQRRGGKANAPNFAQQLADVDRQLSQIRSGAGATSTAADGSMIRKDYENPRQAFADEVKIAGEEARTQVGLQNPSVTNPLGTSTTKVNPDGTVSVSQDLSPDQQKILDQDSALSQMGRDLAMQRMQGGGFGQGWDPGLAGRSIGAQSGPAAFASQLGNRSVSGMGLGSTFNPSLTARTTTGDMVADRRRIEDQVFQSLTRNLKRDKGEELEQLEQTLHNRGVPLDPNNPLYAKAIRDLNERYDTREADALGRAVQMGGDEFGRSVGIQEQLRSNDFGQALGSRQQNFGEQQTAFTNQEGMRQTDFGQNLASHQQGMADLGQRYGMQEQQRATDFSQGLAQRQQGYAETAGLAGFGQGLMMPNFQPYQGPQYDLPNPTDVWATYKGVNQSQQALNLQKKQAAAAQALAGMAGGGGGGQSSAQAAPNPFNGL